MDFGRFTGEHVDVLRKHLGESKELDDAVARLGKGDNVPLQDITLVRIERLQRQGERREVLEQLRRILRETIFTR